MHEEAADLLALYALGALEADDLARVETHLAEGCAECLRVLAGFERAVANIAFAAPPAAPPAALRRRLLDSLRASPGVAAREPSPPPAVARIDAARPRRPFSLAAAALLAAAAAFAVVFLTWSLMSISDRLDEAVRQLADAREAGRRQEQELARKDLLLGAAADPEVRVTRLAAPGTQPAPGIDVLWQPSEKRGVLVARNLPKVEPNRTYELWLIADGAPVPAALFNTGEDGTAVIEIDRLPAAAAPQKFAITVEPAGGSPTPTTDIILVGNYVDA